MHVLIALNFPFTNDEGAYLYDARVLLEGRIPVGDVLTKSPSVMGLFMTGVALTQHSLFANRIVNVGASLVIGLIFTFGLSYVLTKRDALLSGVFWLTNGASAIFFSLGHTQPIAALFSLVSLALYTRDSFFISGVLWALAFSARKTSLALIPVLFVYYYLFPRKKGQLSYWLSGVAVVFLLWWSGIFVVYGWPGVKEVSGIGYAQLVWSNIAQHADVSAWGGGFFRVASVFGRFAAPVLLVTFVGVSYIFSSLVFKWPLKDPLPKIIWLPVVWLLGLGVLYSLWPTWLPEYAVDFLVPLTLLSGLTLSQLSKPWSLYIVVWVLLGFSSAWGIMSVYSSLKNPWTGMFDASAVQEAAEYIQETISYSEPVLTAAVIIPYVSGHRVIEDIAHPYWYRYAFISPQTRNVFLPSVESVNTAFAEAKWAIDEHLTGYFYRTEHVPHVDLKPPLWKQGRVFKNDTGFRSNPISIWRK